MVLRVGAKSGHGYFFDWVSTSDSVGGDEDHLATPGRIDRTFHYIEFGGTFSLLALVLEACSYRDYPELAPFSRYRCGVSNPTQSPGLCEGGAVTGDIFDANPKID